MSMTPRVKALKCLLIAKWRCLTRYDLKGELQMAWRSAWQDFKEAWKDSGR